MVISAKKHHGIGVRLKKVDDVSAALSMIELFDINTGALIPGAMVASLEYDVKEVITVTVKFLVGKIEHCES